MGKYSQTPDNDIAKEPYQGPSVASAMAGEGFIAHFKWAGIALASVGSAAAIFHGSSSKILTGLRENLKPWSQESSKTTEGFLKNGWSNFWLGVFGRGKDLDATNAFKALEQHGVGDAKYLAQQREVGLGLWIANHTVGLISPIKKAISEAVEKHDRLRNAFSMAGPFAFFGYFILPIFLSGGGAEKGRAGKQQFERAKDEIWDLRAENDQLRDKNIDLKTRLTDAETTQAAGENKLRVSRDDPPVIREESTPAPVTETHTPPVTDPLPGSPIVTDPQTGKTSHAEAVQAQREQLSKEPTLA